MAIITMDWNLPSSGGLEKESDSPQAQRRTVLMMGAFLEGGGAEVARGNEVDLSPNFAGNIGASRGHPYEYPQQGIQPSSAVLRKKTALRERPLFLRRGA